MKFYYHRLIKKLRIIILIIKNSKTIQILILKLQIVSFSPFYFFLINDLTIMTKDRIT